VIVGAEISRRARASLGVTLVLCTCCGKLGDIADRASLDRRFDQYVRLVLALGVRDPDSLDFYAGPAAWAQRARTDPPTIPEIRAAALALEGEVVREQPRRSEERSRRFFLIGQLQALAARAQLLEGRRLPFDEESRLLFGVDAGNRDRSVFTEARREIDALLPGRGALSERYSAFDRRFLVAPSRLRAVMAAAIDGCRRVTAAHVRLPPGEEVRVEYVHGMPWSAFTRYEGHARSLTQINLDFALTVDRLFELACHETYPGHHVINSLLDMPVQPMFSPQSLRTEGAATFAVELAFPEADRLAFERDRLFPLAGLDPRDAELYQRVSRLVDRLRWLQVDVARRYLDGELEFVRAATALEEDALMPAPDATLKFFNEFRTYAVTYTVGRDLAADSVAARDDLRQKWRAYQEWIRP
jgi:hypothetical protein